MKRVFVLSLFMSVLLFSCYASNDSIARLVDIATRFNNVFPQEKVYLHLDNTGYFKNERIWFKAYVMRTDKDSLGSLSKVLYVELVSPYGNVEQTLKFPIRNGQAYGDIELKDLLISGFYEIRAYTRYMLNWGADAIFSRIIPIFEIPKKYGDYSKPVLTTEIPERFQPVKRVVNENGDKKINVRFFPEGGKIIKGIPGRIAISVSDKNGVGIKAKCALVVNGVRETDAINTNSDGRCIIEIGENNTDLSLHVSTSDGREIIEKLPDANFMGCGMMVDTTHGDSIVVKLKSTSDLCGCNIAVLWLNNGHVYDCNENVLNVGGVVRSYARDSRRSGVNQIAVVNEYGEILASRMVFVFPKNNDISKLLFQPIDTISGNNIKLKAHGKANACFSLSISDASTQTNGRQEDIASWLLLSSDIRGYIKNPEYYLESDDELHRKNADLLMLVQGWKRYDLKTMMGKSIFKFNNPIEKTLMVDGKLKIRNRKNAVDNVDLSLMLVNKSGDKLYGQTKTDKRGNFAFALPDCYNSWSMIMMTAKDEKIKNYYIGINRHFSPSLRLLSPFEMMALSQDAPSFRLSRFLKEKQISKFDKVYTLKEVSVVAKKLLSPKSAWESEERGAVAPSFRYDCEKDADELIDKGEDVPSLIDYLKMKNPLFYGNDNLSGTYGKNRISEALHNDGLSYDRKPIVWVVNNSFLGGTSFYTKYSRQNMSKSNYSNVESDENNVYFPTSLDETKSVYVAFGKNEWKRFLPSMEFMGADFVTVFVYTTPNAGFKQNKGVRLTYFDGFNVANDYKEELLIGINPDKDFRRTLYWNPNVETDDEGNALIEFTNNKTCSEFIISAEGITKDGKAIISKVGDNGK